ncbi:hypothetical protein IQ07DRAFT_681863 [Pyrenochaeta sp. DS3sAY3a]|nr:hypothetical protein IQ07DRAFT_681863 [Pyrenochaeta sp. DS3sAY3a]
MVWEEFEDDGESVMSDMSGPMMRGGMNGMGGVPGGGMNGAFPRGLRREGRRMGLGPGPGSGPGLGGMGMGMGAGLNRPSGVLRGGGGSAWSDSMEPRRRSAPDIGFDGFPAGGGGGPREREARMSMGMGNGLGIANLGAPGGFRGSTPLDQTSPYSVPPAYSPGPDIGPINGNIPGTNGMPAGGMPAYPTYAQQQPYIPHLPFTKGPPSTLSSISTQDAEPGNGHSRRRPPGHYERVPMGAYTTSAHKPRHLHRSNTAPPTSTRLNAGQPSATDRKVGPSGKEWLEGDAFLDACTCTTNCQCRKSQRVLYRSRDGRGTGGSGVGEGGGEDGGYADAEYGSGEIRYILKDDLGRDCGDHSGCKEDEREEKKRRKEKEKREKAEKKAREKREKEEQREKEERREREKEEREEKAERFNGLKKDLLNALDERFDGLKKETQAHNQTQTHIQSPGPRYQRPPAAIFSTGPGPDMPTYMMPDDAGMDARLAQQTRLGMGMGMGMSPRDAYAPNINMNTQSMQYMDRMNRMSSGGGAANPNPMGMGMNMQAMNAMNNMGTGMGMGMPKPSPRLWNAPPSPLENPYSQGPMSRLRGGGGGIGGGVGMGLRRAEDGEGFRNGM